MDEAERRAREQQRTPAYGPRNDALLVKALIRRMSRRSREARVERKTEQAD